MMMMTRVSAININREHANTWIRTSGHQQILTGWVAIIQGVTIGFTNHV